MTKHRNQLPPCTRKLLFQDTQCGKPSVIALRPGHQWMTSIGTHLCVDCLQMLRRQAKVDRERADVLAKLLCR